MAPRDAPHGNGLIGLDWGTTSLRAYRMDTTGQVLETRQRPWGIMRLPQPNETRAKTDSPTSGFELAFAESCGDWLDADPTLPVIACGMVGSAQGWKEAAYLELPLPLTRIGERLTVIERPGHAPVHVAPGLIQRQGLPNVMRGEETQILGVVDGLGNDAPADEELLIGLPGTHSKWVSVSLGSAPGRTVQDARVSHFETFMTGEVYAALRGHTILGRTMSATPDADPAAFERGVRVAAEPAGAAGPLSTIFSTRTLGLTGALAPSSQADYLSGLLIGHEVGALAGLLRARRAHPRLLLCGEPELCQRYMLALRLHGLPEPTLAEQATARGLWRLALAARLIEASTTETPP